VSTPLLEVSGLTVEFTTPEGSVRAVDEVSFSVGPRETLGLLGESGCGKTVTALALLRLLPEPPARIAAGNIRLTGHELTTLPERELRRLRGRDIAMIFQEPMTALNPVLRIGTQLADVVRQQQPQPRRQALARALGLLAEVGIPDPQRRLREYPHQLSGGMRQRVMIAMALACRPRLLVADEPTTALDVTTQAQVLAQILELQQALDMAVILVTHDLGVIAGSCQRVLVMYAGSVVESGPVTRLFAAPAHPYTRGLMDSAPRIRRERLAELPVIPGRVPDLSALPPGCRFAGRCPRVQPRCGTERPALLPRADGRGEVACHHPHEVNG
jgi:oligopeptide/dipeptide ABC transporter ATP-binding protein